MSDEALEFSWRKDGTADLLAGGLIHREFQAELTPSGDGRNLDLRIVPYGVKARVSDDGGRTFYDEVWEPGVFGKQTNAAHRVDVLMNFEHQPGIGGVVGRGVTLRETGAGAEGTFRMLSSQDADKALELVNERVLTGVSLEAVPQLSERDADGVVHRKRARLVNIALCRSPAFADAQVLAVREAPDEPPVEPPIPAPEPVAAIRDEVAELLERIGVEPLVHRAVVRKPWDGSAARFEDDEYQRSCLMCMPGDGSPKTRCSLPVLEPNGDLNANAVHAAAARLNQTGMSADMKAMAARKLVRYYRELKEEPPAALVAMASR